MHMCLYAMIELIYIDISECISKFVSLVCLNTIIVFFSLNPNFVLSGFAS